MSQISDTQAVKEDRQQLEMHPVKSRMALATGFIAVGGALFALFYPYFQPAVAAIFTGS